MEKKTWKILAIIFMVLFALETAYFIWALSYTSDYYEKQSECAYNVCEGYEAYAYDESNKICYCYNDGEVEYQKYMGG